MKKKYRVIADNSWHKLPIGAIVERTNAPTFFPDDDDCWYTQGGDGDEVCIDDSDLEEVADD